MTGGLVIESMGVVFDTERDIAKKFIEDGWSADISFSELTLEEAKEKGYLFAVERIGKGHKYFKMNITGNIYDDHGEIAMFNMRTIRNGVRKTGL